MTDEQLIYATFTPQQARALHNTAGLMVDVVASASPETVERSRDPSLPLPPLLGAMVELEAQLVAAGVDL